MHEGEDRIAQSVGVHCGEGGAFGLLDSGRGDVAYEDWQGHKLDRKLLDLLQQF